MAEQGETPTGALEALAQRVVEATRIICEVLVSAMMLLISAEVISRSAFNYSFQVSDELAAYLLVGITFLAVSVALQEQALFRVEFFFERLAPRLRPFFSLAFDVCSLIVAAVLEYELVQLVVSSFVRDNRSLSLLATPLYIPQLVMPLGMAVMMLMFLAAIVRDLGDAAKALSGGSGKE